MSGVQVLKFCLLKRFPSSCVYMVTMCALCVWRLHNKSANNAHLISNPNFKTNCRDYFNQINSKIKQGCQFNIPLNSYELKHYEIIQSISHLTIKGFLFYSIFSPCQKHVGLSHSICDLVKRDPSVTLHLRNVKIFNQLTLID